MLSEHLDYWNRLGWKDPFSSAQYSERQQTYSEKYGFDGVYTPQLDSLGALRERLQAIPI